MGRSSNLSTTRGLDSTRSVLGTVLKPFSSVPSGTVTPTRSLATSTSTSSPHVSLRHPPGPLWVCPWSVFFRGSCRHRREKGLRPDHGPATKGFPRTLTLPENRVNYFTRDPFFRILFPRGRSTRTPAYLTRGSSAVREKNKTLLP